MPCILDLVTLAQASISIAELPGSLQLLYVNLVWSSAWYKMTTSYRQSEIIQRLFGCTHNGCTHNIILFKYNILSTWYVKKL